MDAWWLYNFTISDAGRLTHCSFLVLFSKKNSSNPADNLRDSKSYVEWYFTDHINGVQHAIYIYKKKL